MISAYDVLKYEGGGGGGGSGVGAEKITLETPSLIRVNASIKSYIYVVILLVETIQLLKLVLGNIVHQLGN